MEGCTRTMERAVIYSVWCLFPACGGSADGLHGVDYRGKSVEVIGKFITWQLFHVFSFLFFFFVAD